MTSDVSIPLRYGTTALGNAIQDAGVFIVSIPLRYGTTLGIPLLLMFRDWLCQFLLGTVQPTLVEDPSFSVRYAVSCQFLLGTVQLSSYLQQK